MLSKLDFLVPSIYFTIVGFLATAFFMIKEEGKDVSVKVFVIYSVLTVLAFALAGLSGLIAITDAAGFLMWLQIGVFAAGVVHVFTLYRLNSWSQEESFWHEFVFTLYITMLGALVFLLVFAYFDKHGYGLLFTSSFIFFLLPFMIAKCFDYMLLIPEEAFTKWYIPAGEIDLEIPDEMMSEDSLIIAEFQLGKSFDPESETIKSRSKLPLKIEFGRFFLIFLDQYNDRNAGIQIEYLDENKKSFGWNFYIKPKWYQSPMYINPDLTIRENGIKENDIIIAERV